ncbi:MAG: PEP-CTERM sorting domain-containing protein [Phycisphaerae bacterium]
MTLAIRNWLAADLAANTKQAVFVIGHEPAYPFNNHVGDSLDKYPTDRNAFWSLLEQYNVNAYIVGHTHVYSKYQKDPGKTWQFDAGNAGNDNMGNGQTFINITVTDTTVTYDVWRDADGAGGPGGFVLSDTVTQPIPEPATMAIMALGAIGLLRRKR